jgi:hypothetical protein
VHVLDHEHQRSQARQPFQHVVQPAEQQRPGLVAGQLGLDGQVREPPAQRGYELRDLGGLGAEQLAEHAVGQRAAELLEHLDHRCNDQVFTRSGRDPGTARGAAVRELRRYRRHRGGQGTAVRADPDETIFDRVRKVHCPQTSCPRS